MLPVPPSSKKNATRPFQTLIPPLAQPKTAIRSLPKNLGRPAPLKGEGIRRVSPIEFVPFRTRMAYLCVCDRPRRQRKLSRSLVARLDARGGCGLPLALSALLHGDFPRSVYKGASSSSVSYEAMLPVPPISKINATRPCPILIP